MPEKLKDDCDVCPALTQPQVLGVLCMYSSMCAKMPEISFQPTQSEMSPEVSLKFYPKSLIFSTRWPQTMSQTGFPTSSVLSMVRMQWFQPPFCSDWTGHNLSRLACAGRYTSSVDFNYKAMIQILAGLLIVV